MGHSVNCRLKNIHVNNLFLEVEINTVITESEPITVIHDIVSPHRPYPLFIYIFSVVLYELMPKKSQRLAAELTRKVFGLVSYSASTLCRVRKILKSKTSEIISSIAAVENDDLSDANVSVIDQVIEVANSYVVCPEDTYNENIYVASQKSKDTPEVRTIENASKPRIADSEKNVVCGATLVDVCREFQARTAICVDSIIGKGRAPPNMSDAFAVYVGRVGRKYYSVYQKLII